MSLERTFIRQQNRLEKLFAVFGKKDDERNRKGKKKNPLMSNKFYLEPLEPRMLLSADTVLPGITASMAEGLISFSDRLKSYVEQDLGFQTTIPGILQTFQDINGDGVIDESDLHIPTEVAVAVDNNRDGTIPKTTDVPTVDKSKFDDSFDAAYLNELVDVYNVVQSDHYSLEEKLYAMDLNNDRVVDWGEAYQSLVVGGAANDLKNVNPTADPNNGVDDTVDKIRSIELSLWTFMYNFKMPHEFNGIIDVSLSNYSTNSDDALFGHEFTISLTLKDRFALDLGLQADQLEISLPEKVWKDDGSGTRENVSVKPEVTLSQTLSFSFAYNFNVEDFQVDPLPEGLSLSVNDFSFYAEDIAFNLDGSHLLQGLIVNVGFLGTQAGSGSFFEVNRDFNIDIIDPSSPVNLGFTDEDTALTTFTATETDCVLEASDAPRAFKFESDIIFTLKIGANDFEPVEVKLTPAMMEDNDDIDDLRDDLQLALSNAGLGELITAGVTDGKLTLSLPDVDPGNIGLGPEVFGTDSIEADIAAPIIESRESREVSFLLSVAGALPKLVAFTVLPQTLVDPDGEADSGDEYQIISKEDLLDQLQDALNAAFGSGVVTAADSDNDNLIELSTDGTLEITRTLTMGAKNNVTHEEWTEASNEALFVTTPDEANDAFNLVLDLDPIIGINFTPSGDPKLEVHLEPFSDPIEVAKDDSGINRFNLPLEFNDFDQYLDFNVIGPGEIIGLVTQLAGWLDRLPSTYMLGNFSIPFAKAVLGDILDFGDLVEDELLINDSDDGVQPADAAGAALLKFVDDPNSLTIAFGTAQELTARLKNINVLKEIGDEGSGVWADYDEDPTSATYRQLIYHLSLENAFSYPGGEKVLSELIVPVNFSLDLEPLNNLYSDSKVALGAYGCFEAILGIAMGDARKIETTDELDELKIFSGKAVLDTINQDLAITGAADVSVVSGRLTADQSFKVKITVKGLADPIIKTVMITKGSSADNTEFQDLVDDINDAIGKIVVSGEGEPEVFLSKYIEAGLVDSKIQLFANNDSVQSFEITERTQFAVYTLGSGTSSTTLTKVAGSSQLGLNPGYASTVESGAYSPLVGELIRAMGGAQFVITIAGESAHTLNILEDPNNTMISDLVNDINAAIVGTDLEGKILAVQENSRLVFKAIHESVSAFQVESTGINKLGFSQIIEAEGDAPSSGKLLNDATFDIAIIERGGLGDLNPVIKLITVKQTDTETNTSLDDLIKDINDAIRTHEYLVGKIVAERGVGDKIVLRSTWAGGSGTYLKEFKAFTYDAVSELGFVSGGAIANVDGTITIIGGQTSAVSQVAGVFLRAERDVSSQTGRLTNEAIFHIALTLNDSSLITKTVTINQNVTKLNTSVSDLVADINRAIDADDDLKGMIRAEVTGNFRIVLRAIDLSVSSFTLAADANDPTVKEMGFSASQTAEAILTVTASKDAPSYVGLASDATFKVEVTTDSIVDKYVTISMADTMTNKSIFDLVSDVNRALNAAFGSATANPLMAGNDGNRLIISPKAGSGVTGFRIIAAVDNSAIKDLKLFNPITSLPNAGDVTFDANKWDLLIQTGDGVTRSVSLDGVTTISEVIDKIKSQTGNNVDVVINKAQTGLNLIDKSIDYTVSLAPDTPMFRVDTVNGSGAALSLGIFAADTNSISETRDGVIEGQSISPLKLADRLFLREALDTKTTEDLTDTIPLLRANFTLKTDLPSTTEITEQVVATGNFGFVGVELVGGGNIGAKFQMHLKDLAPEGTMLSDLIRAVSQDNDGDSDVDAFDLAKYVEYPTVSYDEDFDSLDFAVTIKPDVEEITQTLGLSPKITLTITDEGNPFAYPPGMNRLFDPSIALDIDHDTLSINGHGFNTGDRIVYRAGLNGVDIGGLVNGNTYYVIKIDNDTIKLATTEAKALKSVAINLTSVGSGTSHKLEGFRAVAPTINVGRTDIGALENFKEITFAEFLTALKGLNDFLQQYAALPFLGEELPLIGVSVNDLVGIAKRFNQAVVEIEKNQAGSIQLVEQKIRETFGLPPSADVFGLKLIDNNDSDSDVKDMLQIILNFSKAFTQALPVNIDLTELLPDELDLDALRLLGTAGLGASGSLNAKLTFGVDLDTISEIYLFTNEYDTSISGNLNASADNLAFNAALGSLGVYVKEGNADFNLDFSFKTGANADTRVLIAEAFGDFSATLTGSAEATLPVFFPNQSSFKGDINLEATFGLSGNALNTDIDLTVDPEILTLDFSSFNLFDNIALMIEAGDLFLMGLQDILDGEVFGFSLPIVGDKLSAGADFIGDFRLDFIQPLRNLIETAPEKTEEIITNFLFDTLKSTGLLMRYDGNPLQPNDTAANAIVVTKNLDSGDSIVDFAQWNFVLGQTFKPKVNFDFDLGFPALGLDADVGLDVNFTWTLGMGFGISLTEGAYIDITRLDYSESKNLDDDPANDTDPIPELTVTIDANLKQGSNLHGQLLFLELVINEKSEEFTSAVESEKNYTDFTDLDKTQFFAQFRVDLIKEGVPAAERLAYSELGGLGFDLNLRADAELNLNLRLQFNDDLLPSTIAALLPAVQTDFVLDWQIETDFSSDFDLGAGLKYVAFHDAAVDLGSFLGDLVVPIVDKIQEVTEPLQPIIDVVTARIPVLSDLAGRTITLIDLAAIFGEINPDLIYAIADIISFVNSIPTDIDSLMIPLGDFVIFGSGVVTASQLLDPNFSFSSLDESVFSGGTMQQLFDAAGNFIGAALLGDSATGSALKGLLGGDYNTETDNGKYGFAFPILEDLTQIFGLLLGRPAVLITYDLPPFFMDFTMEISFPIYPPLYGVVSAGVGLQIDFAFGYDTKGIQDFIEGGASNPLDLLSGLYISDTDRPDGGFGTDVPELKLWGGIGVGAELNLGIASAGVMADISITFNFDLYDPDSDGRVRITELVGTFMNEINNGDPAMAPLSIFDIYGDIAFQLSAYIEIFFMKFDFDITPRIVIWEFEIPFERAPILATERGDGSLLLNIGPNSGSRLNGDTRDIDENIYAKDIGGGKVAVWGMGVEESAAQTYKANKIVAYGGEGNDTIDLSRVSIAVVVEGGSGNDTIKGGSKNDMIRGGIGDDNLEGGAGDDHIWGEEGNDTIHGGAGNDTIFGDIGFVTTERITALGSIKDGNDLIYGDGDNDIVFGGGGDDKIYGGDNVGGADGDDLLFGDSGRLELVAGGLPMAGGALDLSRISARGLVSGNDLIFGNAGNDTIFAGKGNDIIDGGADDDLLYGNEGFDTIYGGGGEDTIYGGTEDDRIFGGRDELVDIALRDVTDSTADLKDAIYGEDGNDFIRGNLGDDLIYGGRGADIIFGDEDNDTIYGGSEPDFIFGRAGNDYIEGQTGNDVIFGDDGVIVYVDFYGVDSHKIIGLIGGVPDVHKVDNATVDALDSTIRDTDDGNGIDKSRTLDLLLTLVNGATDGNDMVIGGEGDDIVFGGAKDDIIFGDLDPAKTLVGPIPAGEDILIGDGGRVQFYGRRLDNVRTVVATNMAETGADTISGNGGNDLLFGGGGQDTLYGRMNSSFSGPNEDMAVVGDNDVMIGDDGEIDYTAGTGIIEKIFTTITLNATDTGGVDTAYGNRGEDIIFGGMKGDTLYGDGSNGGDDIILGDNGQIDFTGGVINKIFTTDISEASGGADTIEGQEGADIIFGGAAGDTIYGDRSITTGTSIANDGNDVILGDNGELDFAFGNSDLATLDLIRSYPGVVGGADTISGNKGDDTIIGGTAGDTIYGDNAGITAGSADGEDVILGDNGDIFLSGNVSSRLKIRGSAVRQIITTDIVNATGGADTIEGNAKNDVILGGAMGDTIYGDRSITTGTSIANDSNDVILGDNGELDFAFGNSDLMTLDLIRSYSGVVGGADIISGNKGADLVIGGTAGDTIYGDNAAASATGADLGDILIGDNADVFTKGAFGDPALLKVLGTGVSLITTTDSAESTGGSDTISGNAGADVILGGVAGDTLYGDAAAPVNALDGDDVILGDNGELDFADDIDLSLDPIAFNLMTLDRIESFMDSLGGVDTISGNAGADTVMGGTAGDFIYGDNDTAGGGVTDKNDLLLGDNGIIKLVYPALDANINGNDRILILGGAVALVRSTDNGSPATGGQDTISGNAGGDIILGGVQGDTLFGDRANPTNGANGTNALDGNDIILGDNGALEWLSTGRLSEILGINVAAQNSDLVAGFTSRDTNLDTLDLITTEQANNGGRDIIYGDNARDVIFGGTDADTLYGDTGSEIDGIQSANGNDLMFGDHGRLYPQFSRYLLNGTLVASDAIYARNFFTIDIGNGDGGEGDRMWGEEGHDIMLGQQGDDRMWGGSGDDDMTGGHNVAGGWDELGATGVVKASLNPTIPVPVISDLNDLMDGGSGNDTMAGDNAIIWRRGDDLSPRFRALTATSIYTTTSDTIVTNIGGIWQSDPADAVGRDVQLVDHSFDVQANPFGRFGADVMAGGADSDVMFGEMGNDLMQGDGFIQINGVTDGATTTRSIDVTDGNVPSTAGTLFFKVPEAVTDGDDYMEGNGGNDLMYGGLGQDDIIGGSSALFGLDDMNAAKLGFIGEQLRPDGSDVIFGGAGNVIRLARNDFVGSSDTAIGTAEGVGAVPTNDDLMIPLVNRHSRDADFIMGDNANVFRPVKAPDDFYQFNYDQTSTYEDRGSIRIIPRAMQQLDYTLGGADYNHTTPTPWNYVNGAAGKADNSYRDNGSADLIYGESGDDIIFGMTGSDIIFGNSDDDDIIGGYGNDWISGGTGRDGVLGDDGLILTSRNSTVGEPLYGIAGLLATDPRPKYADGNVLNEVIATPGNIQYALINIAGELKKTVDLVPFSFDRNWLGTDDEFPDRTGNIPFADDIIFGGLGSDWLHGGSGDDAISGAEAFPNAYVPIYDNNGNPMGILDLGYSAVGFPATVNPGDVLAFNPADLDGRHLNNRFRAGEFALYDEYDPRRQVLLDSNGNLWKSNAQGIAYEFLLNFNKDEGIFRPGGTVPKATGQQTETYGPVRDDGNDAIFGDLGNDWLVGGTGRDNIYGGWGNDLLNADDDQTTNNGLNDMPDIHPTYEDRAYGGAGRDVLIGNTGGDRLIDWVGEYNSYLVPYAPFGMASVSRTLQPFLPEFLYALSEGDGVDPTRVGILTNDPVRNGEPAAELGLVLQKDFAWQAQTGAPADRQAGNIPGGPRDVLRSANFNDGTSQGFYVDSGSWTVTSGRYEVAPTVQGGDAVSVFYVDQYVPYYFEMMATIRAVKPTGGYKANAYLIFDYQSPTDFKFAGINVSTNKLEIGYRDAQGWKVVVQAPYTTTLRSDTDYNLFLALNGSTVTLAVDNRVTLTYSFAPRMDADGFKHFLNEGMVGLGANNAKGQIDNLVVQRVSPAVTLNRTVDFSNWPTDLFQAPASGTWQTFNGYYIGTAANNGSAVELMTLKVSSAYMAELNTTLKTSEQGGFVFDYYGPEDFKFVTVSVETKQILLGHCTPKGGWVIDMAVSNSGLNSTTDYRLGVTLKGSTVSVTLNGQAMLSYAFNALVTDGGFGLLARNGSVSFDMVNVKSDDPALAGPSNLMASTQPNTLLSGGGSLLTADSLNSIIEVAITRLAEAYTLNPEQLALLNAVNFQIADLSGLTLGMTMGNTVIIDVDAAGYGWFIDPTPYDDKEFKPLGAYGELQAVGSSPAFGDIDLLTVVMHELGHVLGLADLHPETAGNEVMVGNLEAGVRHLPTASAGTAQSLAPIGVEAKSVLSGSNGNGVCANVLSGGNGNLRNSKSLVDMEARSFLAEVKGAEKYVPLTQNQKPWLEDFLCKVGQRNPNKDINIRI